MPTLAEAKDQEASSVPNDDEIEGAEPTTPNNDEHSNTLPLPEHIEEAE